MSSFLHMKKILFFILGIIILVAVLGFFTIDKETDKICFEKECFIVEVVDTPQARQTGLMYREELDKNRGMLFIFDSEGNYPFWMKNTLIPLDIIWIDSSGKIIDIRQAEPCEKDPCPVIPHAGSAKYVLEINKGLSSQLGIEVGQMSDFHLKNNE